MSEMSLPQTIAIFIIPVLLAVTLHEVAHGWVASWFGDQTARLSGRLTLNPFKHIDPVGTILVPLIMLVTAGFMFGWAKPVPVDARNLHNPRWNMVVVAAAGPVANIVMAIIWAGIAKLGFVILDQTVWLGQPLYFMGQAGILVNIVLAVLNVLPIPPLDGGRILTNLVSGRAALQLIRFEPYMFMILVLLIITGVLSKIIVPPIYLISQLITNLFALPPVF